MTEARSKRRVLPLFFIVKSFKKPLLIRTLNKSEEMLARFFKPIREKVVFFSQSETELVDLQILIANIDKA